MLLHRTIRLAPHFKSGYIEYFPRIPLQFIHCIVPRMRGTDYLSLPGGVYLLSCKLSLQESLQVNKISDMMALVSCNELPCALALIIVWARNSVSDRMWYSCLVRALIVAEAKGNYRCRSVLYVAYKTDTAINKFDDMVGGVYFK